jgi:hypothetical protein
MTNVLVNGLKERITNAIKINQSIGILLPGSNYLDLSQAIFERVVDTPDEAWVYVTFNKPFEIFIEDYDFLDSLNNIKFIDCISRASGISRQDSNCIYIESPTMLEKLGLEIMNVFKSVNKDIDKNLILDSLTNMIIYNDSEIVTKFFYHIINRTRSKKIHTISLAIEEEEINKDLNRLLYLNNKIIRIRDSFI